MADANKKKKINPPIFGPKASEEERIFGRDKNATNGQQRRNQTLGFPRLLRKLREENKEMRVIKISLDGDAFLHYYENLDERIKLYLCKSLLNIHKNEDTELLGANGRLINIVSLDSYDNSPGVPPDDVVFLVKDYSNNICAIGHDERVLSDIRIASYSKNKGAIKVKEEKDSNFKLIRKEIALWKKMNTHQFVHDLYEINICYNIINLLAGDETNSEQIIVLFNDLGAMGKFAGMTLLWEKYVQKLGDIDLANQALSKFYEAELPVIHNIFYCRVDGIDEDGNTAMLCAASADHLEDKYRLEFELSKLAPLSLNVEDAHFKIVYYEDSGAGASSKKSRIEPLEIEDYNTYHMNTANTSVS